MPKQRLHRWKIGDAITADLLNELRDAIPDLHAGRDIVLERLPGQITVSVDPRRPLPKQTFWARITAATSAGPNRWQYQIEEVIKTGAGYAGWTTKPIARTGDAFNTAEEMNNGSGLEGNGVDIGNLPAGFSLKPAPTGLLVFVTVVTLNDQSAKEFWLCHENAIDGECPA